jgi:hypothetical protein
MRFIKEKTLGIINNILLLLYNFLTAEKHFKPEGKSFQICYSGIYNDEWKSLFFDFGFNFFKGEDSICLSFGLIIFRFEFWFKIN